MGAALRTYQIQQNDLQSHLQQLQAIPYPERSSNLRHVYFSQNQGLWVGVSRRGDGLEVSLFETCPCSGG